MLVIYVYVFENTSKKVSCIIFFFKIACFTKAECGVELVVIAMSLSGIKLHAFTIRNRNFWLGLKTKNVTLVSLISFY